MNSDVDPESSTDDRDESGERKNDESFFTRSQTTFLIILFDVLFAIVLFIVFLIFLTTAGEEAKCALTASRLDFVHLLSYLGAGHCFAPMLSMTNTRKVAIAPNHRVLFREVQSVLLKQSNEDMRGLLADCKPDAPLQVCLLTKVCPHFDVELDYDRYERGEKMGRGSERIPDFFRLFGRRPNHSNRFDMLKGDAKANRAKFVYMSDYAEDLEFCNALFSYVLLSTNMSLISNLAENYTYTLEEPHEVEHVLYIFLSEPAFAGIRRRANCDRSEIQCLLESMCAKEVFNENETRHDLEIFHKFMEYMLKPCLGSRCHTDEGWRAARSEGWFSSCWLKRGYLNNIIRSDRVEVEVPVFQRPCSQGEWSRNYSIIFGVAAVYIFILAFFFLLLEFFLLFLHRRCFDRLARLAAAKNVLASAVIVPSHIPSRRSSPRSSPRGSPRSNSENSRGRLVRDSRLGAGDQFSSLASLAIISNTQSARSDSGLGFNTRLSTPRSASIPHLRMVTGLPGRRLKASNDYVFTAFESGSMSILPTPITRPPTIRRSFSVRQEPILNFLGETVIEGGGEILELAIEERPPEPSRPAPTPITPQEPPPRPPPHRLLQRHHDQHSQSFSNLSGFTPHLGQQRLVDQVPARHTSSFQAIDNNAGRRGEACLRDSGMDSTLIDGAEYRIPDSSSATAQPT